MTQDEIDTRWSRDVAGLAVDALLTAKLISKENLDLAHDIVAEEIRVRLVMDDRPDKTNWRFKA